MAHTDKLFIIILHYYSTFRFTQSVNAKAGWEGSTGVLKTLFLYALFTFCLLFSHYNIIPKEERIQPCTTATLSHSVGFEELEESFFTFSSVFM